MKIAAQILFFSFLLSRFAFSQPEKTNRETDSLYYLNAEILVTANRVTTTKLYSPERIQVIDKEIMSRLNGSRLSDVMSFSDGVFIKDYGFNSGLKTISLNATQSEHTLFLYNGIKLNNRQNSLFDIGLLQIDNAERIEILSGGSSALYGSESIGGVVSISDGNDSRRNKNDNKDFTVDVNLSGGSYGFKRIYWKLAQNVSKSFRLGGSYTYENSNNDYKYYYFNVTQKIIKYRQNSDYQNQTLSLFSNVDLSRSSGLRFFIFYSHWIRSLPGIDAGYSPGTAKQIDRDVIATTSYSIKINSLLNFETSLNYKYSLMSYYDPATFGLTAEVRSFYKLGTYSNYNTLNITFSKRAELNLGSELNYSIFNSNETEEGKQFQAALFVAGKYSTWNSFITAYPSVRYDYYSNIGNKNVFTGKFGINIKPFHKIDFALKSTLGNNFNAPTFNELYWKESGNKDLLPERSVNFDAGLYYRFRLILNNEIEFSYFNINTIDRIIWKPWRNNLWRPVNIGKVKSEGITAGIKSVIKINSIDINFAANYNYGTALKKNEDFPGDPTYGKQLIYIPQEFFKASLGLTYMTTSKYIKFVSLQSFYSYYGNRFNDLENMSFVPQYMLFDGNINVGLKIDNSDINLKFAVNNILNEDYQVVPGYPMPLRNFKLELSFKY